MIQDNEWRYRSVSLRAGEIVKLGEVIGTILGVETANSKETSCFYQTNFESTCQQSPKISFWNRVWCMFSMMPSKLYARILHILIINLWREKKKYTTWQDHFNKIAFLDITSRFYQLKDVFRGRVMAKQQDLIIHSIETTLGELQIQISQQVTCQNRPKFKTIMK